MGEHFSAPLSAFLRSINHERENAKLNLERLRSQTVNFRTHSQMLKFKFCLHVLQAVIQKRIAYIFFYLLKPIRLSMNTNLVNAISA